MRIRQPVKEYDPFAITDKINEFWTRTHAYRRTKNSRAGMNKYYVVDGPPFTVGDINIGHARNKIIKDSHIRFMSAQGLNVIDRPGFDVHGLPVELSVEENLGFTYRSQIEEFGVEKFVTECTMYANGVHSKMVNQFKELGIWMDWDNPYVTSTNSYIESVWWTLKEAYKKKILEKQRQVTAWCPKCESPLTRGEINYNEKNGPSVYLKIPIKGRRDEYIIVWTTTPWTFTGALAIAVNPDYSYARVAIRQGGRKSTIIVLESQVEEIARLTDIEAYEIIESIRGDKLEKLEFFHPLMADIPFHKTAKGEWNHKVITIDSVKESHTGCVYIAPGLGIADSKIGVEYSLPIFSPMDERGIFTTEAGVKYAGQNTDEGNRTVIADMKTLRFVLKDDIESHKFGHCWRCDSPIIHRSTEQWFLKTSEINDIMNRAIKGVSWMPEQFSKLQKHDRLINANDWCVSRQRFWGTPLPLWECITDVCGHIEMIGSLNELEGANGFSRDMDLHRPWIDKIALECPKCGGLMKRVPDILDVWFDSSVASWAQLSYPRKKKAFKELWPGDWVSEGQDQIKGWIYNQIFSGVAAFNKIPFRKVLAHGVMYDEQGRSLNKSPSQFVKANAAIDIHGIDALRFYMLGLSPGDNAAFNPEHIKRANETLKAFWNCYVFSASYMHMDNWDPEMHSFFKIQSHLQPEDQWLLSRIETLNHEVKRDMENMMFNIAVERISDFIKEDLSRGYIKLVRERIWREAMSADKDAALFTLRTTLAKLAVISNPFVPYISEYVHQELNGKELTVNMAPWPEIDAINLTEGLERGMRIARSIIKTSHKLRQNLGISLRWPVKKMTISASNHDIVNAVNMFLKIIKEQTNVKELELVPEGQEWAGQELIVVPNPNIIGKAYKQRESKIARMLQVLPAKEVKAKIDAGEYSLGIEGELIRILPEMVQFETKLPEGVVSIEFKEGIIYLDTNIDDSIKAEGFAREIIRRVQQMRSDMHLDPEEFIRLRVSIDDGLIELLNEWFEKIADTTRASQMEIIDDINDEDYIVEWPIKEETVVIGVTSLNIKKAMDEFIGIKEVDKDLALSIVESGITNATDFLNADREELLKIPGMSYSKLRKIKEFLEVPEGMRQQDDEQSCPLCLCLLDPGSVTCQRCGKNLLIEEDPTIELAEDPYAEEETDYREEIVRERVKIGKKKKEKAEEEIAQPEDEIISMATATGEKIVSPEDMISSEIMDSIGKDTLHEAPRNKIIQEEIMAPQAEITRHIEPEANIIQESPVERPTEKDAGSMETLSSELENAAILPPQNPDVVDITPDAEIAKDIEQITKNDTEIPENEIEIYEEILDNKSDIIGSETDELISRIAETFDIKPSSAKILYNNGYKSVESLLKVQEEDLRSIKGIGKVTARRIVQKISSHETKMCSLCNAIVPIHSPACTRCGVKFIDHGMKDTSEVEKNLATLESLENKMNEKPSDASLLHSKAMALRDAGNKEGALSVIDEALDISPNDEELLKVKKELESSTDIPVPEILPEKEVEKVTSPAQTEENIPPPPEVIAEEEMAKEEQPGMIPIESEEVAQVEQEAQMEHDTTPEPEIVKPENLSASDSAESEIKLKGSFTYLILEERSAKSYRLFKMRIDDGMQGYCVTRTFPEKIRERYELGDTPILWLSNVAKEEAVRPKDLEKLSLSLEEFLGKEGGIILLDGIEYLITNNNFITVLKLIQSLRDQVAINRSILLISINQSTMDSHQINLLKREVDSVIEDD